MSGAYGKKMVFEAETHAQKQFRCGTHNLFLLNTCC